MVSEDKETNRYTEDMQISNLLIVRTNDIRGLKVMKYRIFRICHPGHAVMEMPIL